MPEEDLAGVIPSVVDVDRTLLGEIEAATANGATSWLSPQYELVVQLRAAAGRRAEVRVYAEPSAVQHARRSVQRCDWLSDSRNMTRAFILPARSILSHANQSIGTDLRARGMGLATRAILQTLLCLPQSHGCGDSAGIRAQPS